LTGKTWTYQYDAGGNIRNKKEYAYTTIADLSGQSILHTYNYIYDDSDGNVTWSDLLESYDGKAILNDEIGNRIDYDGKRYVWEAGRQLKEIYNNNGTPGNTADDTLLYGYQYNDEGIRTAKTAGGVTTRYTLIGDKVTFETNGTDELYYRYDSDGSLVSFNFNGTEYFYIRNLQGDITGLLDADGNIVTEYTYDAWGKLLSITGSLSATIGFRHCQERRTILSDCSS